MEKVDSRIPIYAVYDIEADNWYMLGAYPTFVEIADFYQTMLKAPFWKDRLSALYIVGLFDLDTGDITVCEKSRVMMGGKSVSEITPVPEDHNSEGAGGELSPQKSKSERIPKRFSIFRKIFGSVRHD